MCIQFLKHFHTKLKYDLILLSFVELCSGFPASLRGRRNQKDDASRETVKQRKYKFKKCIPSRNLIEIKFSSVMIYFHASFGIFLGLYLSATSSLKLGLSVLGIWVCLFRWDKGLTYKSLWWYQVKRSLQGLLALSVGSTITVFHDIVQDMEPKQQRRHYYPQPPCAGSIPYFFSPQNVCSPGCQISGFFYRLDSRFQRFLPTNVPIAVFFQFIHRVSV